MIGKTVSHYRIIDKLGEGGMGVVYRAEDTRLDRTVALKFLTPQLLGDENDRARFVHEAKAAAALNHPNICTIYAIEEDDGCLFIAMELVEGRDLRECMRPGPMDIADALSIASQSALGLSAAHRKGIVHRDIKPANIIVTPDRHAKIMDFGLARTAEAAQVTRAGTTVGTVAYMSPEQARGDVVDRRTDLWSLGVVLYEMLAGERPFKGDRDQAVIHSILNDSPRPMSAVRQDVSRELESVVDGLLIKSADARSNSASGVAAELDRLATTSGSRTITMTASDEKIVPSIAVMPFADMSPEHDQEYFCDGMSEEIINELTSVSGLRVIARTSAFSFKNKNEDIREIGRKLNVTSILEGSVRKAGDRVRITAQLINVDDGSHVWSERYDRVLEDVFAIQDEIAAAIADKLRVELTEVEQDAMAGLRKIDPEAHDMYLRGRHLLNRGLFTILDDQTRVNKAIEFFRRAAEVDPTFAAPHAGLADVYSALCRWIKPEGNCERAKEEAILALELDDESIEAHVAMGRVALTADLDWDRSRTEFLRALELNPGSAEAHKGATLFYTWAADFALALEHAGSLVDLDPLDYDTHLIASFAMGTSRSSYAKCLELSEAALDLFPGDRYFESNVLWTRAFMGIDVEATAEEYASRWPNDASAGVLYAMAGRVEEARQLIELQDERKDEGILYAKARIYAALGEKDEALNLLEQTWENEPRILLQLNSDAEMDVLRGEQRFKDLLERSGIPMGELAHLSE